MTTYVSVDMAYWTDSKALLRFLYFYRHLPSLLVKDHQDLLPHIDTSNCTRLVNIDYHDDLCLISDPIHCRNWVDHVSWAHSGSYTWIYPEEECFAQQKGFCYTELDLHSYPQVLQWQSIKSIKGETNSVSRRNLVRASYLGVAISKTYWRADLTEAMYFLKRKMPKSY